MDSWAAYWTAWFAVMLLTFGGPEAYALISGHPENTLSAKIWDLEDMLPGESPLAWSAIHALLGFGLIALVVWLIGHLVFGIWR